MVKFQITLDPNEANLLTKWAEAELRDPREQIRFIVRMELERRGLLISDQFSQTKVHDAPDREQ